MAEIEDDSHDVHPIFYNLRKTKYLHNVAEGELYNQINNISKILIQGELTAKISPFKLNNNENINLGTLSTPNVEEILKYSKDSHCQDNHLFHCKQINSDELNSNNLLELINVDPSWIKMKSDITSSFKYKNVNISFNRLLIFSQEGYCERHTVNKISENHTSKLLISLTTDHKGGDFKLYRNNHQAFEWHSHRNSTSGFLKYIVFDINYEYEIKKVTDGNYICLEFDIFSDINNEENGVIKFLKKQKVKDLFPNYLETFRDSMNLLSKYTNIPVIINEINNTIKEKEGLAIPLVNFYPNFILSPHHLKGIDLELYEELIKNGYDERKNLFLVHIVSNFYYRNSIFGEVHSHAIDIPRSFPPVKWRKIEFIINLEASSHRFRTDTLYNYDEDYDEDYDESRFLYLGGCILVLPAKEG